MKDTTIGLDLAKSIFYFVELNRAGKEVLRKKFKREALKKYFSNREPCHIVMEACGSSHYWARVFKAMGHKVTLLPPQHVKAYLRGQKNDYNDAVAIAEASQHGRIRPVAVKSIEQQDEQSFHRIRKELTSEQTRIVNQMRGLLLEHGVCIAKGVASARGRIPEILEDADNELSTRLRELISRQYQRFLDLEEELAWYKQTLETQSKNDEVCQRLIEMPAFGPINSSAFKSWIGDGKQFKCGRDASAALGVVPRQHSSAGKEVLLGITKRGDRYVRSLIIHGARSVVTHAKKKSDPLSCWINKLVATRGYNKAVVALANKLVRIAWVIVSRNEHYKPQVA